MAETITEPGMITNAITGATKLFTGGVAPAQEHFWGTLLVGCGAAIGAGIYTRKRTLNGDSAIGGVLF